MRKPTTDDQKRASGTYRPSTSRTTAELTSSVPEMPTFLSEPAQAVWKRIVPKLADAKMVAELHSDALALYCETWARFQADPGSATSSMVAQLRLLQGELGLTPRAAPGVPKLNDPIPEPAKPDGKRVVSISALLASGPKPKTEEPK